MKRILLAEDDNDMRRFLVKALKNAGYEVVSFDNGRSAPMNACGKSPSRCC
jgi:two-component system cell cycle response regulator CpdR